MTMLRRKTMDHEREAFKIITKALSTPCAAHDQYIACDVRIDRAVKALGCAGLLRGVRGGDLPAMDDAMDAFVEHVIRARAASYQRRARPNGGDEERT